MKRVMTTMTIATILGLIIAAAWGQEAKPRPKTLIWNYVNPTELKRNAKLWHDVKGIDGFIFCNVSDANGSPRPPRWTHSPAEIADIYHDLPETIKVLKAAGMDENFVTATLDDSGWNWFDQARYDKIVPAFRELARLAKATGCKGVAIDTEPYSCDKMLWNPDGYPANQRPELKRRIRTTGEKIAKAIMEEYPEAKIILFPEGSHIAILNSPDYKIYDLWMDFFAGLVSQAPKNGITVLGECSYNEKNPLELAKLLGSIQGSIMQGLFASPRDLRYFKSKCSIGLGAAVLGEADKKSKLSPAEFAVQWRAMQELSSNYVFIFAGESGFWQAAKDDKCNLPSFKQPLTGNADLYFKVIRDARAAK